MIEDLRLTRRAGLQIALVLMLVACVVGLFTFPWVRARLNREHSRTQLVGLMHALRLGDSTATVQSEIAAGRFKSLRVSAVNSGGLVVKTPLEWGAKNWVLYVLVDEGEIVGLQIRTEDTRTWHPSGAPPDRLAAYAGGEP